MTTCGSLLQDCRCNGIPTAPRTAAQVAALHHQAVRRAQWSGHADDRVSRLWAAEVLWPGTVARLAGRKVAA